MPDLVAVFDSESCGEICKFLQTLQKGSYIKCHIYFHCFMMLYEVKAKFATFCMLLGLGFGVKTGITLKKALQAVH